MKMEMKMEMRRWDECVKRVGVEHAEGGNG